MAHVSLKMRHLFPRYFPLSAIFVSGGERAQRIEAGRAASEVGFVGEMLG